MINVPKLHKNSSAFVTSVLLDAMYPVCRFSHPIIILEAILSETYNEVVVLADIITIGVYIFRVRSFFFKSPYLTSLELI